MNNVCVSFECNRVNFKPWAMLEMYTETEPLDSTPQIHVTRHSLANLRKQVNSPGRRVNGARHSFHSERYWSPSQRAGFALLMVIVKARISNEKRTSGVRD